MCITYTVLLHGKILRMKISYTINEGKICITPGEHDGMRKMVKVYNQCLPDVSFLHLKGKIPEKITSLFNGSTEEGVIISVQFLEHNTCLEFESRQCWKMNYYPSVVSMQLMLASTRFLHRYENPAAINRVDIYIRPEKALRLIKPAVMKLLQSNEVINLSEEENGMSLTKINGFLHRIIKKIEKPADKSLCTFFEKFIQSVTI